MITTSFPCSTMRLTVASKTAEKTAPSSPPLPRPSTALPSLSDRTLSAIAAHRAARITRLMSAPNAIAIVALLSPRHEAPAPLS